MNFIEAVKELKTGKKVRKISWSNTEAHIKKVDGNHYRLFATIYNAENSQGIPSHDSYSFREYEILANDWEIYEDKKVNYMNIIEAVKLLQSNNDKPIKLMRRNKDYEIILDKVGIFLTATCVIDGRIYKDEPFTATINDILAEDWYVVKCEKLHTFEEVLKAYKSGKTIKRSSCYNTHNISEKQLIVTVNSLLANDWIIIDKEETK